MPLSHAICCRPCIPPDLIISHMESVAWSPVAVAAAAGEVITAATATAAPAAMPAAILAAAIAAGAGAGTAAAPLFHASTNAIVAGSPGTAPSAAAQATAPLSGTAAALRLDASTNTIISGSPGTAPSAAAGAPLSGTAADPLFDVSTNGIIAGAGAGPGTARAAAGAAAAATRSLHALASTRFPVTGDFSHSLRGLLYPGKYLAAISTINTTTAAAAAGYNTLPQRPTLAAAAAAAAAATVTGTVEEATRASAVALASSSHSLSSLLGTGVEPVALVSLGCHPSSGTAEAALQCEREGGSFVTGFGGAGRVSYLYRDAYFPLGQVRWMGENHSRGNKTLKK